MVCRRVVLFVLSHNHVLTGLGGWRILPIVELIDAVVLLKAIVRPGLFGVKDDLGWLLTTALCEHDGRQDGSWWSH